MPDADNQYQVSLPPELQTQFAKLERRLWKLETSVAVCLAITALAGTWLAVYFSDRFWDSPRWLRLACAALGTAGWAGAVVWWARRWVFRRRDLRSLANLVQRAHRRLGDRLLGIVELAGEREHHPGFSPELYRAAILQVAGEAARVDFDAAVSSRPARTQAVLLSILAVLGAVAIFLSPATGWNVLQRWSRPWAAIPRHTLVEITGLPAERIVAHGEPFELTAEIRYLSAWKPSQATLRWGVQPALATRVDGSRVRFKIPGQVESGPMLLRIGDASRSIVIQPTYRPVLRHLNAEVAWPGYLRHTNSLEKIEDGTLSLLEGSQVAFQGEANRPLRRAELRLGSEVPTPLQVDASRFSSPASGAASAAQAEFFWSDLLGLDAAAPWRLAIQWRKDSAPSVELPEMARDVGMLATEVLNVKVQARDDFGVRDLGLQLDLPPDSEAAAAANWPDFKSETALPRPPEHQAGFAISPAAFHIPAGTSIELRGLATDDLPGRRAVQSQVHRIHVLSSDRHAEMIRQRMESMLAHLEEVARAEEKIAEDARALTEMSPEKQGSKETGEKIAGLEEQQRQAARNLEQMAREGMNTLREAIRNPSFDAKTVNEWAKTLQEMQQLSGKEMPKASQAMESARQSQSKRQEKLGEAKEQTEKIVDSLQKLQKKANSDLDDLQALTLAQRLRQVAETQRSMSSLLQKTAPDTVGLLPSELPPGAARTNFRLSTNQVGVKAEAVTVQGEIGRFFERTQRTNYGKVTVEMKELQVSEHLEETRSQISENRSLEAVSNLGLWAGRFDEWAAQIEPPQEKESESSGKGEGGDSESQNRMLKMLTTLLRTREGETNLREQTRLIDRQRTPEPRYLEDAARLMARQEELVGKVSGLRRGTPMVELATPLAEAEMRMVETLTLLRKPITDEPTITAQNRSIDALSDLINLINEQGKKNPSQSPGEESSPGDEMKFLTQMMSAQPTVSAGMPMQATGGGNMAGGDTDDGGEAGTGSMSGRASDSRAPSRAGGAAVRNAPVEFREALEDYYRAVEKAEGGRR